MELSSITTYLRTLQRAEFVALLAAANVSKACFTRVCGRQRLPKSVDGAAAAPARSIKAKVHRTL